MSTARHGLSRRHLRLLAMWSAFSVAVLLPAVAVVACASGDSSTRRAPTITTVDGVRTVDNHTPAWREGEAWRIANEPALTLGVDAGEPWEMFTYPDAIRLSDGRIVVADRMSKEVRWFAADGSHLVSRGGDGEGPGEYAYLWNVESSSDDSVLAYDPRLERHTLYDAGGDLVGTLPLADHGEPYWRPRVIGVFADGSLFAEAGQQLMVANWLDLPPDTIGWYHNGLFRYDAAEASPRFLGRFEQWESTSREGQNIAFEARAVIAPYRDGFCHANGRQFEIRCYDLDGALRQHIRWPGEPDAVTAGDRERYIARSRENVGNVRDGERWIRETVWSDTVPVLHDLQVDAAGNVWAERHIGLLHTYPVNLGSGLFNPDASPWEVFSADGTWLGRVDLPPGRTVQQIGDDWLLLAGDDDAGVAHVWLYDLIKH